MPDKVRDAELEQAVNALKKLTLEDCILALSKRIGIKQA
jgi:hypothetical protein